MMASWARVFVEDGLGDRAALGRVGVEQAVRHRAAPDGGQLPAEVRRIGEAEVEALAAEGRVDVGGVAGEQDPAPAVGLDEAGIVRRTTDRLQRRHAHVRAGDSAQHGLEGLARDRRFPVASSMAVSSPTGPAPTTTAPMSLTGFDLKIY